MCNEDGHQGSVLRGEGALGGAQVVIVPTPASTNALVLRRSAPSIPAENITTLTRLAHNRMLAQVGTGPILLFLLQLCRAGSASRACMLWRRWRTSWPWLWATSATLRCGATLPATVRCASSLYVTLTRVRTSSPCDSCTGVPKTLNLKHHGRACVQVLDIQHASVCGTAMANVVDAEFEAELRAAVQQRSSSIVRVKSLCVGLCWGTPDGAQQCRSCHPYRVPCLHRQHLSYRTDTARRSVPCAEAAHGALHRPGT